MAEEANNELDGDGGARANFSDMLRFAARGRRQWNQLIEIMFMFGFLACFFAVTTFVNEIGLAFDTIQFTKFVILADRPEQLELSDTARLELPSPRHSMWNDFDDSVPTPANGGGGGRRGRRGRRRLRGVGGDDDEGNYFEQELTDEQQLWTFLSKKLGMALLDEVPLERCRSGLCQGRGAFDGAAQQQKFILQVSCAGRGGRVKIGELDLRQTQGW